MGETVKWVKLMRQQRKEHEAEISRMRLEYEALLLHMKDENSWLKKNLIEAQGRVRTLTYEIERKEAQVDDLQKLLRGEAQLGRSTEEKACITADDATDVGRRGGDISKQREPV